MLKFDLMRKSTREERVETYQQITRRLAECKKHIRESVWRGLTELTQKNGENCSDSVGFWSLSVGKFWVSNTCIVSYTILECKLLD